MGDDRPQSESEPRPVTTTGRWLILITAFLGWLFGGFILSTTSLTMRSAAIDLMARSGQLDRDRFQELTSALRDHPRAAPKDVLPAEDAAQLIAWRKQAQAWFGYYTCAMLFGAAAGGLLFGRLGDRIGRAGAMACSILCFSALSGVATLTQSPIQLLIVWFLASLGVGGMWPNGVALVAETWSGMSRPLVAGIMGMSANIGIFAMATLATYVPITADQWRWVMLVDAGPVLLGLFVLAFVPESPRWLAARRQQQEPTTSGLATPPARVFRPPLLWVTLVGIVLATIPLIGGWGSANWMMPWAAEAGEAASPRDPFLKARVGQTRALTGILGSMLGGWVAHAFGRLWSYCLVSLAALICAQYAFWFTVPTDAVFLFWVGALGFFSGIYFGWLPLFLPELFPTRVRSTGSGVCFNFGRVLTAATVFATSVLTTLFSGDYARIGRITSLCYAVGIIVIWFAPDTSKRPLED